MRPTILLLALADRIAPTRLPHALRDIGFDVGLLAEPGCILAQSSYIDYRFPLSVARVRMGFLSPIVRVIGEFTPRLVIPCDDLAVQLVQHLSVAHEGARAPGGQLPVPVPPSVRELLLRSLGDSRSYATRNSRLRARAAAASLGIGVPEGAPVPHFQAAESFAQEHGYPVVLKREQRSPGPNVRVCGSPAELRAAYAELANIQDHAHGVLNRARYVAWSVMSRFRLAGDLCATRQDGPRLMIEVFVPGQPCTYAFTAYSGRLLAGIAAMAEHTFPEAAGRPSVVRFTQDRVMPEAARRMVGRFGFTGFGGIDFIRDPATRKLWFSKFDPRPTPFSHLGHLAGGDLGTPLMAAVSGTTPVPQRPAKDTTVALFPQDWMRDPDAVDRGAEHLDVPEDDPRLLAALWAQIRRPTQRGVEQGTKPLADRRGKKSMPDDTAVKPAARSISGKVGGTVEILRDRAGVPHIYADSTADLWFGVGIAMAEDRLWQMDRLRRRALGRQAEILGPSYVAMDSAHLTVGLDLICDREVGAMDAKTRAVCEAMVAGINRQIELFGKNLPPEFKELGYAPAPFTVRDVIAIGRGIWWSLNGRIDRIMAGECARLFPTDALRDAFLTPETSENLVLPWLHKPNAAPVPAGTGDGTGSNNWAIAGARTDTGKAILSGDPHQPFWVPSSWWEYAVHGPEDDYAGAGHPGFPGAWWGSNGSVAWSITNNAASTRDLYREEVDPADASRYRDGDGWKKFEERTVEIPVKGEAARKLTVRSTVRGPIVNALVPSVTEGGEPPLSMRWVGAEHIDDVRASIAVGRARNWNQFRDALRDWSIAVFNYVYADKDGHVGYQMCGRVPIRGRIHSGLRDANNAADQWKGYIPFDDLPNALDPERGYVASANQRIVPPDYPQPLYGAYSQGHRGIRIDQAFGGGKKLDKKAAIALQNDVKNVRAERMCPHIVRQLAGASDADAKALAAMLKAWDGEYTLNEAAPTVFETFMNLWQREVLAVHLPERLIDLTMQQTGLAMDLLAGERADYLKGGTTAAVEKTAKRTMAHLREKIGKDAAAWAWGKIHLAHWKHPVGKADWDIGPEAIDGGSHTVRNTGGEQPPHSAASGAEYRLVVDFATPDSFLAVQNIGNSGVPGTAHYKDQFLPFIRGEYHTVHLQRAGVEADCESRTVIRAN